ncbi:MAG: ABC transporter ATP-binding protein, partial [Clostridia bacterium]
GVRPVDVVIDERTDAPSAQTSVAVYENLGDERRVGVRVGDSYLNLTTTDNIYYERGDLIKLTLNADRTHLFDVETGERIRDKA